MSNTIRVLEAYMRTPKSAHCSRLSGSRNNAKYASKVKCFTLQPAQDASDGGTSRVMLGLKDTNDDSCCDYEQRSVLTKPKGQKENFGNVFPGGRKNARPKVFHVPMHDLNTTGKNSNKVDDGNFQTGLKTVSLEDANIQSEKQIEERIDQENSVTFYNSIEQNENSKAFIESLGSWINDLFNGAPNKNTSVSSVSLKNDYQRDSVMEEDPEYLKSISAIKEQFRKKLKSETSIQVSAPDEPFIFNFDRDLDKEKKIKKSVTSLPASTPPPTEWIEELDEFEEQIVDTHQPTTGLVIRTSEVENLRPTKNKTKLNLRGSILVKEKKKGKPKNRHDISELEEYIFPTPSELSRRILLNVNDNEKCGQLGKNPQSLGMQESQHYGQRKSRSRQTNARCYTTKANPADTLTNSQQAANTFSHYCTSSATAIRSNDEMLRRNPVDIKKCQNRKPSKKEISDISRDSMTFLRMNSQKAPQNLPAEIGKGDTKTSSDDLVKYLMKKIKNTRPHHPRHKTSVNVPQLLSNPKHRFMQSATNTLVSVMAKKDIENQSSTKNVPRPFPDVRINPSKDLFLKNSDANMRLDVSRAISSNNYSRLSYLLEDNRIGDDGYLLEKGSKRSYDEMQKQGAKKQGSKFNKRQEVKNMLSKIDMKEGLFEMSKSKQKEPKKRDGSDNLYMRDEQNARFQKQHELFKTNLKLMQQNLNTEPEETKNEVKGDSQKDISLSRELAVIEKHDQEMDLTNSQESPDLTDLPANALEEKTFAAAPAEPEEFKLPEPENQKADKKMVDPSALYKEKILKPLQFFKDADSSMVLNNSLEKFYVTEQIQKDGSKVHESPLCPAEVAQVKPMDMMLLNRRYSTNTLNESMKKPKSAPWVSPVKTSLFLDDIGKDTSREKEAKDKKKAKTPKMSGDKDSATDNCGFDKVKKKPGPNCEKDEKLP